MNRSVIDLDSLGYIVAWNQFSKHGNTTDETRVVEHIKDYFNTILQATEAEEYMSFFGGSRNKNFRNEIYPEYKSNRPESPEWYLHWKDVMIDTFKELGAIQLSTIESDDALSIIRNLYPEDGLLTLCHADKDMAQCWGLHYNIKKHQQYFITKERAKYNLFRQILIGDTTDNIPGCKNIGEKKADKLLSYVPFIERFEDVVKEQFVKAGSDYDTMYKLVKLLDDFSVESFDIKWIKNENLVLLGSLFESGS